MTAVMTRDSVVVPSEIFTEEPKPFEDDYARRCFRVLRMVAVLHGKGFQGLRVFPYKYPLAYRIELFPATYAGRNGVRYDNELFGEKLERERLLARHSGAHEARFFGWDDVSNHSAHRLALTFIERFSKLARATYHLDYAYAGWFASLLDHCEYGHLPYLFGEFEEELDVMRIHHVGRKTTDYQMQWFPLPPRPSDGNRMDPRPVPRWLKE